MMMDAVGEKNALCVPFKSGPIRRGTVGFRVFQNSFEGLADSEVPFAVLVKNDVAPGQSCLRKIVDQRFLLERELVPARHLVPQNLEVANVSSTVEAEAEVAGASPAFLRRASSGRSVCRLEKWRERR